MDTTVPVPEDRIAEFHIMYGHWLAGTEMEPFDLAKPELLAWTNTKEDEELARAFWAKLSDRAKSLFSTLMDAPEKKFSGEDLAEALEIPNGKYGTAGVLAWPGRYSSAVGRFLPCNYENGPFGAGASYSMTTEVAELFHKVRDN